MAAIRPIDPDLLVRYANEAMRGEAWFEAYALWSELDRANPLPHYRVMALESARLAGILPLLGVSARDRIGDVLGVLTPPYAENLLEEILRRREWIPPSDTGVISAAFGRMPERVRRALLGAALAGRLEARPSDFGGRSVKLTTTAAIPRVSSDELFSPYGVALPALSVAHADSPEASADLRSRSRGARRLIVEGAVFTSGSDAIERSGRWYVDSLSYPHSAMLDVSDDPVILAVDGRAAVISSELPTPATTDGALWLAYPSTQAWGHFVLECLTRLAIFQALTPRPDERVIVSSSVPDRFLDVARYLYPWARFVKLAHGMRVAVGRCSVIPSAVLTPGRIRWTPGGSNHLSIDPKSLGLLAADMASSLRRNSESTPMFRDKVYLDRSGATYRRSESEAHVRRLARTHNFVAVDPGTLAPPEEINLFVNATDVCGFSGSQLLLGVGMTRSPRQLYVYHDESSAMRSLTLALSTSTGTTPDWILGTRPRRVPGYSEQSIHQPTMLSEAALEAAGAWMSDA